jgi:hypothetical protein
MGTNYYWIKEDTTCPHCGRRDPDETSVHIGKSSCGWCFSLHVDPSIGIGSLDDWIERFDTGFIEDEYGDRLSVGEMMSVIVDRYSDVLFDEKKWMGYRDEADFHLKNQSFRGPNNLLRHKIGRHCIGNGAGTWDLIVGEFS